MLSSRGQQRLTQFIQSEREKDEEVKVRHERELIVHLLLLLWWCRHAPYPNLNPDQSPSEDWTLEERFRPLAFHGLILRSQLVTLLIRGVCYSESQSVHTHTHTHILCYSESQSVHTHTHTSSPDLSRPIRAPRSPGCPMQR